MTRDLRTLLNLELSEECSRTLSWNPAGAASGCNRGAVVEADTIGEQRTGTRSGAAAEADASDEHAAAAEAGAIDHGGSSSWKRTQTGSNS